MVSAATEMPPSPAMIAPDSSAPAAARKREALKTMVIALPRTEVGKSSPGYVAIQPICPRVKMPLTKTTAVSHPIEDQESPNSTHVITRAPA